MDNKNSYKIEPIFPLGVYIVDIGQKFNKIFLNLDKENIIKPASYDTHGAHSENTYILNKLIFKDLKNLILSHCKNYGINVLGVYSEEWVMTQSWITIKPPQIKHDFHVHPNSVISGVLYYGDQNEDTPGINFKNTYNVFDVRTSMNIRYQNDKNINYNKFNTRLMKMKFKPNTFVLFPSYLSHGVDINNSKKPRKSLAFNVLPKTLGHHRELTELKLDNYE